MWNEQSFADSAKYFFYVPKKKRRLNSGWLLVKDGEKEVNFLEFFFLWMIYLTKCQIYWSSWFTLNLCSRNTVCRDTNFRPKQKLNTGYVKTYGNSENSAYDDRIHKSRRGTSSSIQLVYVREVKYLNLYSNMMHNAKIFHWYCHTRNYYIKYTCDCVTAWSHNVKILILIA